MFRDNKPPQLGHEYTKDDLYNAKKRFTEEYGLVPQTMVMNHRTLGTLITAHPTAFHQYMDNTVCKTTVMGMSVEYHNDYESDDVYIGHGTKRDEMFPANEIDQRVIHFYDGNYAFINRNIKPLKKPSDTAKIEDYTVGMSVYRPHQPVPLEVLYGVFTKLTPEGVE